MAWLDTGKHQLFLTLWSSGGVEHAFDSSRAIIEEIRPQGLILHGDPFALGRKGRSIATKIRNALGSVDLIFACYGDSYGPDPSHGWKRLADAAMESDVVSVMPNCEAAWKSKLRGDLSQRQAFAEKAIKAFDEFPDLHVSFTSYPEPCRVVIGGKGYGGHGDFPWLGFFGGGRVKVNFPQVYISGFSGKDRANFNHAQMKYERQRISSSRAKRMGWFHHDVVDCTYLQAHSSDSEAIGFLASTTKTCAAWAAPSRIDSVAIEALKAVSVLKRHGKTVEEWQAANGLKIDGRMGPKTIASILSK